MHITQHGSISICFLGSCRCDGDEKGEGRREKGEGREKRKNVKREKEKKKKKKEKKKKTTKKDLLTCIEMKYHSALPNSPRKSLDLNHSLQRPNRGLGHTHQFPLRTIFHRVQTIHTSHSQTHNVFLTRPKITSSNIDLGSTSLSDNRASKARCQGRRRRMKKQ